MGNGEEKMMTINKSGGRRYCLKKKGLFRELAILE
jgi:hypothetical protein